jgi:hypothetical protein
MAAKPIAKNITEDILNEWMASPLSQGYLSVKYNVSKGFVNKICKGVDKHVLPSKIFSVIAHEPRFIYIFTANEFDGAYKIGLTNDIERRLADMQTGCPFLLIPIKVYKVDNPTAIEIMLHSFFKKKRIRGEWFRLTDIDISYIDEALSDG